MWEQIRILCHNTQPRRILMDFEEAAINSFKLTWPHTIITCSFFHLKQNVWRMVQAVGLQDDYINNEDLAMRIRQIPSLAFVLQNDVDALFGHVAGLLQPYAKAAKLLDYFRNTYVGRKLPNGYYYWPTFSIDMWSYYEKPFGIHRITNAMEAWHRSFNCTIGCHHSTLWKFIAALKREQGLVEVRQARFRAGEAPTKRKYCQASEQAFIDFVWHKYDEDRKKKEYLEGVAHHFSLGAY